MTDAVITGTYSDFKLIKTRQVAQMIIEVPLLRDFRGMSEVNPADRSTIENAIRALIGVKSRADMRNNDEALKMWENLLDSFTLASK